MAGSFGVFNPCDTGFGAKGMWPRGYPLSLINSNASYEWRVPPEQIELGAIQSMANHDPDVDALYRLAPRASQPLPYSFYATKQPQVVGAAVYAPFNAQACVFTRRALWAMYLPTTVHGRVSDIWRSYVAQRIFWTIGLRLAFHKPWVTQVRNSHDYLSDYMSERPLYETSEELLRVLQEWSPPLAGRRQHADEHGLAEVPRLLEDLYINLYEHGERPARGSPCRRKNRVEAWLVWRPVRHRAGYARCRGSRTRARARTRSRAHITRMHARANTSLCARAHACACYGGAQASSSWRT